jgi:hypothetical protein
MYRFCDLGAIARRLAHKAYLARWCMMFAITALIS